MGECVQECFRQALPTVSLLTVAMIIGCLLGALVAGPVGAAVIVKCIGGVVGAGVIGTLVGCLLFCFNPD